MRDDGLANLCSQKLRNLSPAHPALNSSSHTARARHDILVDSGVGPLLTRGTPRFEQVLHLSSGA